MSLDRTQHQSTDEITKARELSLAPAQPPSSISGYKIVKFLGSGAYGEVWSADDLKTGRRVAIKFYTRRSAKDVELLAREIEKLVVLAADRYVVQLLDVGWESDPPYFVMDYIEQGSLEDRLNQREGIPVGEAVELFEELATGLMHLHDKGVLHCDLKPGNVLLDQDGKPRVADFGQSRLSTESIPSLGTLFYMAPEQADLKAVPDARWDVYSLGALLYSMLTGQPPYFNSDLARKIEKTGDIGDRLDQYRSSLMSAPRPTAHRSVAGVDRALAEIIDRCVSANPRNRFNNIQALLTALQQREIARARLPVMILGLLGPILLISVMALFGWWAFRQSVSQTQHEITKKAVESNDFAASLAARSAAEQIDEYFRVVGQLSRSSEFLEVFTKVIRDPELDEMRIALSDPANNYLDDPSGKVLQIRENFRDHPLRKELQPFLETRLHGPADEYPLAASWFINDRYGNQIASAFRSKNQTLGKNYSYRSYFTGLNHDLKTAVDGEPGKVRYDVAADIEKRKMIGTPHLSAVFISEQSNTWKIAFSAPVRIDGRNEGVVAVTVNLGSFIDFNNVRKHYAMLVDARLGENRGIILEHPLFQEILSAEGRLPDALAKLKVDLKALSGSHHFLDPVVQTEFGKEAGFHTRSIFASAPVTMEQPRSTDGAPRNTKRPRLDTQLIVLAVEDFSEIEAPANALSRQLSWLALAAFLFLLAVSVGMWFLVRRLLAESRQRLDRSFATSAESSFRNVETMPAHLPDTE